MKTILFYFKSNHFDILFNIIQNKIIHLRFQVLLPTVTAGIIGIGALSLPVCVTTLEISSTVTVTVAIVRSSIVRASTTVVPEKCNGNDFYKILLQFQAFTNFINLSLCKMIILP